MTLISKQEAAAMLGISPWTLRTWRRSGLLVRGTHFVVINPRNVKYIKEALEALPRLLDKGGKE